MLLRPEQPAAAPKLGILFGKGETVRGFREGAQPLASVLAGRFGEEVTFAGYRAATDAAAHLVELRQAEALGMFDDQQRRVWHIDADFDHRRRDEQIDF